MLFTEIDFIIFFVIVLAIISAIKYRKFQHVFLLTASYFFFYYSSNYLITLLIASTILDFYIGKAIWSSTNITKKKIDIEMHPTVYNMLFEEESSFLEEIEKQNNIEITFQVNPKLHLEKYKVVASS